MKRVQFDCDGSCASRRPPSEKTHPERARRAAAAPAVLGRARREEIGAVPTHELGVVDALADVLLEEAARGRRGRTRPAAAFGGRDRDGVAAGRSVRRLVRERASTSAAFSAFDGAGDGARSTTSRLPLGAK